MFPSAIPAISKKVKCIRKIVYIPYVALGMSTMRVHSNHSVENDLCNLYKNIKFKVTCRVKVNTT